MGGPDASPCSKYPRAHVASNSVAADLDEPCAVPVELNPKAGRVRRVVARPVGHGSSSGAGTIEGQGLIMQADQPLGLAELVIGVLVVSRASASPFHVNGDRESHARDRIRHSSWRAER